jgi:hypothetical protein
MEITTRSIVSANQDELLRQVQADELRILAIKEMVAESNESNLESPQPYLIGSAIRA